MKLDDATPFRVLVIADLSGRGNRGECRPGEIASRPILRVDIDSLERVMKRLAPRLALPMAATAGVGAASRRVVELDLAAPGSFHPDSLLRDVAVFRDLRRTRARLADPLTFAEAATAIRAPGIGPESTTAVDGASAAASGSDDAASRASRAAESDAGTLERILGRAPVQGGGPTAAAPVGDVARISAIVRELVTPHLRLAAEADPRQAVYLESLDATTAGLLRDLLHHPDFQALEAAWTGVRRLVNAPEADEGFELFVLDASRDELAADLASAEAERSALYRRLLEGEARAPDAATWSLLLVDVAFGTASDDLALLAALGALALRAGAPLLAGASPALVGAASVAALAHPRDWLPLDAGLAQRWQALRSVEAASSICLALPRLLLRAPYGANSDPIDSFEFEELGTERSHEDYLWGNGAFACAMALARGFADSGWALDPALPITLDDLPAHLVDADDGARLQPCAETLIGEAGAEALMARGLTPLLSYKDRNAARVPGVRAIARADAAIARRWPVR